MVVPLTAHDDASAARPPGRTARLVAVSWRHWFREVAVIAAGALAALAAQAWWQDRQDRERERDYLRQLLVDVRDNERRLTHAIAIDSMVRRSADVLSRTLSESGPLPPADTLVVWLIGGSGANGNSDALSASDFQPVTGTFTALMTTGDLRLIRDERLRAQLVAYATRMEGERENLRLYWQQGFSDLGRVGRVFPFLAQTFSSDSGRLHTEARHFPFARLRGNADVAAMLFTLQAANANRLSHLRGMRNQTRSVRQTLEAQERGRLRSAPDSAPPTPK